MKKKKIVCTIGPSSSSRAQLRELIESGMDVARLNFSHGDHTEKLDSIKKIREVSNKLDKPVAILCDIQGPKLRLGAIDGEFQINTGDQITLSNVPGAGDLPMQTDISGMVDSGHRIFLNDGLVELVVTKVKERTIIAEARNDGVVTSHKGINIPDTHYTKNVFTKKDRDDIRFAIGEGVEYIALSFIQSPQEVINMRRYIKQYKGKAKICVKIEKNEAIEKLEEVISVSDVVMIARGDLAIETSPARVPVLQQQIIRMCREKQKPVVVATQMLESMIENPRPTRAEASDVGHAVMSQVDAVMLSAESAMGRYPAQAVRVMKNIIESVENAPEFKRYIAVNWENIDPALLQANSITAAAESLSYHLHAPLLAVASATGSTAFSVASFRPNAQVIAVTHDEFVARQLNLVWGLYPIIVTPTKTSDKFWEEISSAILKKEYGNEGDRVVMIGGSIVGVSGATDTIKVLSL